MQATIDKLKEKKILIWGYGREGRSTEKLIRGYCAPAALDIYEGPREGVHEENYDYVFVSPGIPFEEDAPAYDNRKFTSQTELFLEEYGRQTIGITGTKGKSTTSSMLAAALKEAGKKVFLVPREFSPKTFHHRFRGEMEVSGSGIIAKPFPFLVDIFQIGLG